MVQQIVKAQTEVPPEATLMIRYLLTIVFFALTQPAFAAVVKDLKVTVLSTMLANDGIGEWGYAALVEADGRRILFDAGANSGTVLANAKELGIDLSRVEEVIISHNHGDHTGGLTTLRREMMKVNAKALSRVHVSGGAFLSRPTPDGKGERNSLLRLRSEYEGLGGQFVVHDAPIELMPGIWFSGPVPRVHSEKNYPVQRTLLQSGQIRPDTIPEDAALIADTGSGLVVLTGCGHAGIINIAEHARRVVHPAPLEAVIGGLHLFNASEEAVTWTAGKLRQFGLKHLLAGHCTGLETTWQIRERAGLSRGTAAYGAVGSTYTLGIGIDPTAIAR